MSKATAPCGKGSRVNEILQPVRLADDDSGVLTELRIRELPFEELRRAPDSAERVLDFVSEVPEHLTAGFESLPSAPHSPRSARLQDPTLPSECRRFPGKRLTVYTDLPALSDCSGRTFQSAR